MNRRRQPFQGCALPPELPGHFCRSTAEGLRVVGYAMLGGIAGNRGLLQCGSLWNSPDYSNQAGFPQCEQRVIRASRLFFLCPHTLMKFISVEAPAAAGGHRAKGETYQMTDAPAPCKKRKKRGTRRRIIKGGQPFQLEYRPRHSQNFR